MFRPSSRVLAKMLAGMASTRCLMKRTVPVSSLLEPFHQPLAVQSPRFFANNQEKSSSFKGVGKSNALEIGPTRFTFNIMECKSTKEIVLSISESDKETHQHRRQIWLSMTAAKTLLERVETNRLSAVVGSLNESCMDVPITKFEDTEKRHSIELKFVRDRVGDIFLKILVESVVEDKSQAILVRLDGVAFFQQKLANMIRNYEKLIDPNRPKGFEDLCNKRSFFFEPKSYFFNLSKSRVNDEILVRLSEYNKKEGKKRDMFIPIKAAQDLIGLLKGAYEIIQWHEGCLSGKQPLEVLHEKSFADQVNEYTVQVAVSELEMRHLGDMSLMIKRQGLDNESMKSFIFIRSHGVHLLLDHLEKILQEYYRRKPILSDLETTKSSNLIDVQRKQMRNQELDAWKAEVEAALADLNPKNWKGTEEDRQKEFPKRKEKFAKKLEAIRKKYSDLT